MNTDSENPLCSGGGLVDYLEAQVNFPNWATVELTRSGQVGGTVTGSEGSVLTQFQCTSGAVGIGQCLGEDNHVLVAELLSWSGVTDGDGLGGDFDDLENPSVGDEKFLNEVSDLDRVVNGAVLDGVGDGVHDVLP